MCDIQSFSSHAGSRAGGSSESAPRRWERAYRIPAAKLLAGFDMGNGLSIESLTADRGCIRNNGDGTFTLRLRPGISGTIRLSYAAANDNMTLPAMQIVSVAASGDTPAMMTDGIRLSMIWPEREPAMREDMAKSA